MLSQNYGHDDDIAHFFSSFYDTIDVFISIPCAFVKVKTWIMFTTVIKLIKQLYKYYKVS